MKMGQIILFLGLFFSACSQGGNTEHSEVYESLSKQRMSIDTVHIINEINEKVARIENDKQKYGKVEQDIFGKSSEGGVIMAYYDNSSLKKVKVTYYGEMGNATFEYYIDESNVIFIRKEQVNYNKPMYLEDSEIASVEKNKYYFVKQELLLWKNNQDQSVNPKSDEFKKESNQLLNDFNEIKNLLGDYQLPIDKPTIGDTVRCKYGSRCQDSGYIIKGSRSKGRVIHVKPPLNKDVPMEQE